MKKILGYSEENPSTAVFRIVLFNAIVLIVFGLCAQGDPLASIKGMWTVWTSHAGLVTDFIVTGGLGGAFINAGLAMILSLYTFKLGGAPLRGSCIATCFIVAGFALFGKTALNMIPIILGSVLYAKMKKEPFAKTAAMACYATCLGPAVTHIALYTPVTSVVLRLIFAFLIGIGIGIAVPVVGGLTSKIHNGYLIFNGGFAAGFVGTVFAGIFKNFGWEFSAVGDSWSTEYDLPLSLLAGGMIVLMFISGLILNGGFHGIKGVTKHSGKAPCDYVNEVGLPVTMINMGLTGMMSLIYVLAIGGNINGPTLAGIFTNFGFGAFCMNFYNIIWPALGIVILSLFPHTVWNLNDSGIILGTLFSSCICGIGGDYGIGWGIISGMLHVSIVRNTAVNYGWLNLYNNGYAGGLVCMFLLPFIHYINGIRGAQKK